VNKQQIQTIALQAAGEYMMNHIADVMEMVQDIQARHNDDLNEKTLVIVEAQVKAIAEELSRQSKEPFLEETVSTRTPLSSMRRERDE
jgi:hypothetical protein